MIVEARRRLGAFDLQDLEEATRAALQRAVARLLKELLEETEDASQAPLCSCGAPMRCEGPRPKRLVSLLGSVSLRRLYYHCRHCWRGTVPFDSALDIEGTQYSPGVRRLLAVVGGETPFARGRELLAELAGIAVSFKAVERQAQAIGSDLAARAESDRLQAALRGFPPQSGEPIPTFYIEMDGTGMPVTAAAGGPVRSRQAASPPSTLVHDRAWLERASSRLRRGAWPVHRKTRLSDGDHRRPAARAGPVSTREASQCGGAASVLCSPDPG